MGEIKATPGMIEHAGIAQGGFNGTMALVLGLW
jgi:hypothetical protein